MNYILFDGAYRDRFLPLTFTRPVAELRVGILTIKEKWEMYLGCTCTVLTEEYLEEKFPMVEMDENVFIDASIIPDGKLAEEIDFLSENELLLYKDEVIAFYSNSTQEEVDFSEYVIKEFQSDIVQLTSLQDIITLNEVCLRNDYQLLVGKKSAQNISETNNIIAPENVFIEEGAVVEFVTINASTGPVYIAKDSLVMEGTMIRGPFALGENSVVKMGSKIYGGTAIGPKCTIGGELKNVIFIGNSNKGHEGYLGDSIIGEWCNFGADTNCSNVKNTFSNVQIWNYEVNAFEDSGLMKFGAVVGDYTKTGINTMLNTGTIVGVNANIFAAGFPEKYIPSFSWGSLGDKYDIEKAIETAKLMHHTKNSEFSLIEEDILRYINEINT